jgi:hypothetical protein
LHRERKNRETGKKEGAAGKSPQPRKSILWAT